MRLKADDALKYQRETAIAVFNDLLATDAIPRGYFRNYVKDNIRWLEGKKLSACDAGRHSIAIDASGNVSACLAMPHIGNLRRQDLEGVLRKIDRASIKDCSDQSTCNLLCSRVVGSMLRNPIVGFRARRV